MRFSLPHLFLLLFSAILIAIASGCGNPPPDSLRTQLRKDNPAWHGELMTGYYTIRTPLFDFNEQSNYNAVLLNGPNLNNLSAFAGLRLRIVSMKNPGIRSLDFLKDIRMEPHGIIDISNGAEIADCAGLSALNPESVSLVNLPSFRDTRMLGDQLKYLALVGTGVTKFDLKQPELLRELQFESKDPMPDIAQISKMNRLNFLYLKNTRNAGNIDMSKMEYLETLVIENADLKKLPNLSPKVIRMIYLLGCSALNDLSALQGKMVDRLVLVRSGDPGKLLGELHDLKINSLFVEETTVTNLNFYRKIKDLNLLRFRKCNGVPGALSDPFVEIIVNDPLTPQQ